MAEDQRFWTAEEIAARIMLDPALLERAKPEWDAETETTRVKPLLAADARRIVTRSIVEQFTAAEIAPPDSYYVDKLAALIVQALPEEAMNGSVVAALDVRPYVQLVTSEPRLIRGDKSRQGFRPLGDRWQELQQADYRTTNTAYTQTNKAGVSPAVAATEQTTAIGQGVDANPFLDGVQTVDPGDLAALVRAGRVDINAPDMADQAISAGNLPGARASMPGGGPRVSYRGAAKDITGRSTIGRMLDWAYGLEEDDVSRLQSLLFDAGYMTDMKYDPQADQWIMQDMQYEDGYANDPVFQQAWMMAIRDTYAQGNGATVAEFLGRKTTEFKQREQAMRTRLTEERMMSFNESLGDVRAVADRLAMDTVGRRLNPEEFVQVRQYLRSLQTERADDWTGPKPDAWMEQAPEAGFTTGELEQQVSDVLVESSWDEPGANYMSRLRRKYES
jgi:hypothetical protein